MSQYRLLKPTDVLFLRGNQAFGDAGQHGTSSMPPSPSALAGALRSYWLASLKIDFARYQHASADALSSPLREQLGSPKEPRGFRLSQLGLAWHTADNLQQRLYPLPADLVLQQEGPTTKKLYALQPNPLPEALACSQNSPSVPLLKAAAAKPLGGYWLTETGFQAYLAGKLPRWQPTRTNLAAAELASEGDLIASHQLWKAELRLGIGLSATERTAAEGQLYTSEAIALHDSVYLWAQIDGAADYPKNGLLRLGGDGRSARMKPASFSQQQAIEFKTGSSIKLLLLSPGLFSQGSRLPGEDAEGWLHWPGGKARVVASCLPRHQVISGWDLAQWQPKPAERVVPAGSIYWLDQVQGSVAQLESVLQQQFINDLPLTRRAEGYNSLTLAHWIK